GQLLPQSLIVSPERERKPDFGSRVRIHQVERFVVVIGVLFQDPRFHLGAAVGERDAIQLVLDHRLGFAARLFCSGRRSRPFSRFGCGSKGATLRLARARLLRWRRLRRAVKEFREQQDNNHQRSKEEHPPLDARLMLWVVVFGQVYRPFAAGVDGSGFIAGSKPPLARGWQRKIRSSALAPPRSAP